MGRHSASNLAARRASFAGPTTGAARYVGRVGALALAMGIGVAVAGGGGVAWADGTNPTAGTDGATRATNAPTGPTASDDAAAPHLRLPGAHLLRVIVHSAGGLLTGTHPTGIRTPKPLVPESISDTDPAEPRTQVSGLRARSSTAPTSDPQATVAPRYVAQATLGVQHVVTDIQDTIDTSVTKVLAPGTTLRPAASIASIDTFASAEPTIHTATATPHPTATFVGGLLAALGVRAGATNGTIPVGPMGQVLTGALETLRREIEHTFFTKAPQFTGDTTSLTNDEVTAGQSTTEVPLTVARQALAPAVDTTPGTVADLVALPDYLAAGGIRQSGYQITYGSPSYVQDSGFDDPTGSSTGHLDITVTRPLTDTYPGDERAVYVFTELVDDENPPSVPGGYPIGTFQRIEPGQTITVRESYVEQFAYPDGYSGPRQTLVSQRTYALYAVFSHPIVDGAFPTAPTITTTGNTDTTVDLRVYGGGDDLETVAYKIYRDGQLVATVDDVDSGTYTDTGLTPDTTYHYTARAVDFVGHESPDSAPPLTVTTHSPDIVSPTAPSLAVGEVTDTTVSLHVFGGTDDVAITAYRIYRDGVLVATVDDTESGTYTDTGLTPDTNYVYQASAMDNAGNESPLNPGRLVITYAYSDSPTGSNYDPNDINEQAYERVLDLLGAVPVVGELVSAAALGGDLAELRFAIANRNRADIRDEIGDILADAAGLLPFGRFLKPALAPIADVIAGQLIDFLI